MSYVGDVQLDVHGLELCADVRRQVAVGDDDVDLVDRGDEGETALVDLARVEDGDHLAGHREHH